MLEVSRYISPRRLMLSSRPNDEGILSPVGSVSDWYVPFMRLLSSPEIHTSAL